MSPLQYFDRWKADTNHQQEIFYSADSLRDRVERSHEIPLTTSGSPIPHFNINRMSQVQEAFKSILLT